VVGRAARMVPPEEVLAILELMIGSENRLHSNGTRIVKIFLHLSKEDSTGDYSNDDKWSARLLAPQIILDRLQELDMSVPQAAAGIAGDAEAASKKEVMEAPPMARVPSGQRLRSE